MSNSFYFYDLETSGFNTRQDRVMQFAGQRVDENLENIGEPDNFLIKLTPEILPDPGAVLVTGITPQQTLSEGVSEAEFLKVFHNKIALPGTTFVGFNSIRFDDEFLRYMMYRNFYDPYEWQWSEKRSKWDMLDLVRMTRALRPEGIKWPLDSKGKPTNKLGLLASINKLSHEKAHDALSDVKATIGLARLIKSKQPKLFSYLYSMRQKQAVQTLVSSNQPFVYCSGKYPSEYEKTAVVGVAADHPSRGGVLVFDLRFDPSLFFGKSASELATLWQARNDDGTFKLPVKLLLFNRCPAIAPLGVVDASAQKRLGVDMATIKKHYHLLKQEKNFAKKLAEVISELDKTQAKFFTETDLAEEQLYDSFIPSPDKPKMRLVRATEPGELNAETINFQDERLQAILPRYKARNFPEALTDIERSAWEEHVAKVLQKGGGKSQLSRFGLRLQELASNPKLSDHDKYLLEDLRLYGETVAPIDT